MKKRLQSVPIFLSEDEERAFWQDPQNDSTDYLDWSKADLVHFPSFSVRLNRLEAHRPHLKSKRHFMPTLAATDLKPSPEAEATFRRWLKHLDEEFCRHTAPDRRAEIVRDELFQMYLGRPHGGKVNAILTSELAVSVLAESFDPRNVTLAAEHEEGVDAEQYAPRRPLIYFWQMFDRSPLGLNHWLGLRFRCMLGRHIFRSVGKGVRISHGVEFSRGYTVTLEDNCTLESNVQLDDRQELLLPQGTTVAAGTRPYPSKNQQSA